MPFPVRDEHVRKAETELGRPLRPDLRERLMRDNGGEIQVDGYAGDGPWVLHPVWDPSDPKRMSRTADHLVRETREAHQSIGSLPRNAIVLADNSTGDLLLMLDEGDEIVWWDHETGGVEPVAVDWS